MKITKRILGLLVVLTLCITSSTGIQASQDALGKAKQYYQQVGDKKISSADDIIAIEAIGIEVEDSKNGFDISGFLDIDFTTQSAGALGKTILALCLVDKDPRDINGVDLVALLESYYQADGSFGKEGDWVSVGTVPFDVFALKTVGSTLDMSKTITYFTSQQDASGAFGYESGGFNVEFASTGWAMLALDYLGASDASTKAKQFLDKNIDSTLHGWEQYSGLDANNQASVLWSLYELGYTEYQDELQALLTFQCQDGSFGYQNNTTSNKMATQQAMLALGVKYNGSIIDKAISEYTETIAPPKKEESLVSDNGSVEITGKLPVGTKVQVEEIKETNAFEKSITSNFKINIKQLVVLDISLVGADGKTLQPEENVTVKVKLPDGFSNETVLYHQQKDGSLVSVPVTIENGYVSFTTNSFSKFIFVEKENIVFTPEATEPIEPIEPMETTKEEVVKTGDTTQLYSTAIIVTASLLAFIILVEKKKKI